MNCEYRMRCDTAYIEGSEVSCYGIEAVGDGGVVKLSIPAVFIERERAESLVESLNRNRLAHDQLFELLDDLL